jgi:hypothetical protein
MDLRRTATITLVLLMVLGAILPAIPASGPGEGKTRANGSPLGPDDALVQYAILTTGAFVGEFTPLAEWKTEKGVYAKVYETDWVTNQGYYQGRDRMEQYHAFLRDLYNHTDGGLRYLLIGGDEEVVRTREIWTGIKEGWEEFSGPTVFSDHYYAGLSHDWDANGDGRYGDLGEEDWDAEIAVGRVPVSSPTEAATVVDKLLDYEKQPEIGDWMRRAVLVSSVMNPPNANITNAHHPDHIYKWWEDNAWESLTRTFPLVPEHMEQYILYDYNETYGGNYTPANDTLNETSYKAAFDMGSSVFASVTHGFIPTGNGIPHYDGDGIGYNWTKLLYWKTKTDVPPFYNGNMTPFAYFSSCYIGNFTEFDDSNFEVLLTMDSGGVIGFIAPSENTYRGEESRDISDGNWWMSETFWKHMFQDNPRPGDAFYQMIREYEPHVRMNGNPDVPYFRQNHAAYNLLGDPEMPIWFDLPKDLNLELPQDVYALEYDVPVQVTSGGMPVEGARVAFKGEDFYAFGDTNETGWAVLSVGPKSVGQSVKVTATAPQHLYTQTTIGISPAPAELVVLPNTLHTAKVVPEAGVAVQVSVEVRNIGHENVGSFLVQFYDGDPADPQNSTPIGDPVDIPGLQSETTAPAPSTWQNPTPGWHEIFVVVDPEDKIQEVLEINNVDSVAVFVSDLNARVVEVSVRDAGDPAAIPFGEDAFVNVVVESAGTGDLGPVRVQLFLGNPGAGGVKMGADRSTAAIPSGEQRTVQFTFTPGQIGEFTLVAVADPLSEIIEFDEVDNTGELAIRVGKPPFWDPIPGVQMLEDATKELDVTRYVHDFDTEIADLTFSIHSVSTNMVTTFLQGRVVNIVPDDDWWGDFVITLEVDDGDFTALATIDVTMTSRNDAPEFIDTGIGHEVTIQEGEPFTHQMEAIDPDGDPINFTDNSELFDITRAGLIEFTPSFEDISHSPIHVVRFIITDGESQTFYPVTFMLEALNTPPVLQMPEHLSLAVGESFSYKVNAVDREGDTLTFSEDSDIFEIIPGTGQILLTPTRSMMGEYVVNITVTDGVNSVHQNLTLEIVGESEEGDVSAGLQWAVLAGEIAIIIVGLFYIIIHKTRGRKKE